MFDPLAKSWTAGNLLFAASTSASIYDPAPVMLSELSALGLSLVAQAPEGQIEVVWALVRASDHVRLVFRGTDDLTDFGIDVDCVLTSNPFGPGKVHKGVLDSLTTDWADIVSVAVDQPRSLPLFIDGHSLGAAHAALAAWGLKSLGIPVNSVFTYGMPRIFDKMAAAAFSCDLWRCVTVVGLSIDFVPTVPPAPTFWHTGNLLLLNSGKVTPVPDDDMPFRFPLVVDHSIRGDYIPILQLAAGVSDAGTR
jgi:hypothetical protein